MIENNTSNVFAAFKILIDEIEYEIELINKAGLIAWERRDYRNANKVGEYADQVTTFRDEIISLRNEWQSLVKTLEGKIEEKIMPLQARNYESEEITGTKPTAVSILGQSFAVRYWRDVFELVMNTIVDLRPDKFEQLKIRLPYIVGLDEKKFTKARKLKNEIFIEVNLSALSILRYCSQALESVGLSSKDFVLVTAHKDDGQTLNISIPESH